MESKRVFGTKLSETYGLSEFVRQEHIFPPKKETQQYYGRSSSFNGLYIDFLVLLYKFCIWWFMELCFWKYKWNWNVGSTWRRVAATSGWALWLRVKVRWMIGLVRVACCVRFICYLQNMKLQKVPQRQTMKRLVKVHIFPFRLKFDIYNLIFLHAKERTKFCRLLN